jgi:hypothetical protein
MAQRAADQITLTDLTDGVAVILSSESYSFPGTISAAIAGSTTTKVQALVGTDYVAASVVLANVVKPAGVTVTMDANATAPTLTIAVSTAVVSGGEVVIPVTVNGLIIEKKFTYSISFKGTTGDVGTAATSIQQGVDALAIPTDLSGTTTSASTITIPFAGYLGTARVAASVVVSGLPTGITVSTNTAATSAADGALVLAVATASTLGATDTGTITLTYTVNSLTFVRRVIWAKAKQGAQGGAGGVGTSATLADLRVDSFVIPTDNAGLTTAAQNITIPFAGYLGASRVAATAAITGLPTGMTAGTNTAATASADGSVIIAIATASNLGATDTGTFTVSVTANGIVFPLVVSWSKSKQGGAGINATTSGLFNEAQMIPADAQGAVLSAQTISVNFFGYVGSTRAAATATVGTLPTGMTVGVNTPGTVSADGILTFQVAAGATLDGATNGTVPITLTVNGIPRAYIFSWSKSTQGSPGITLEVASSLGNLFKNTQVATTLSARVYQGGVEVTGAALTALGTIKWYKDGSVTALATTGASLTVAAGDVLDRATYEAKLEY